MLAGSPGAMQTSNCRQPGSRSHDARAFLTVSVPELLDEVRLDREIDDNDVHVSLPRQLRIKRTSVVSILENMRSGAST